MFDFDVVQSLARMLHTIFSGSVPPFRSGGDAEIDPETFRQVTLPVATVTLGLAAADAFAPPEFEKVHNVRKVTATTAADLVFDMNPPIVQVLVA